MTDNTMALNDQKKGKNKDKQWYKKIKKMINTNPIKNRGLTQVTRKGFQLKAITVLLYRSFSKMFLTWMFCFVEDNKVISTIEKAITEPDKKKDFHHTSGCLGVYDHDHKGPHSIKITTLLVPVHLQIF
jgi:hypothetical protein